MPAGVGHEVRCVSNKNVTALPHLALKEVELYGV